MKTIGAILTQLAVAGAVSISAYECHATPPPVDFERVVRSILHESCVPCHGAEEDNGQLRLDVRSAALAGGFSGPAVVPGDADKSLLYQHITSTDPEVRMPRDADPLRPEQIELIRRWIEEGATWPETSEATGQLKTHWAYVKPVRPELPSAIDDAWVRNAIDAFVLVRLKRDGLGPSPEAAKETLIRRVTLDLTGLPPALAEIDAFVADESADAYERVVDRLLASPHYGERWAQAWLDAARYADSNGYTNDRPRSMWLYRDWVITALNNDMPFDEFTVQQIAGDLLPDATVDQRIATGFHRNAMWNDEQGVDQDEARWNTLVERVGTTATVWLGSTLACAQCHNHKYDPFSQKEFYGLLAFFENTRYTMEGENYNRKFVEPILDLGSTKQKEERDSLKKQIADAKANGSAPAQINTERPQADASPVNPLGLAELTMQLGELTKRYPQAMVMEDGPGVRPATTRLRIRGSYLSPEDIVPAATPAVLHPLPADAPLNRLTLARWLVDPNNPLAARIAVNRAWAQFFGRGLVETPEDFGTRGAAATHPELLDWLATEFQNEGWSTKRLHKSIVLSATYRQSSQTTPELRKHDPENRLLARGPRFRLNAEFVRDVTLAASGLLNPKIGGPSVFPPQPETSSIADHGDVPWHESEGDERHRRGLYIFWRRSSLYPALATFDAPSREICTVSRPRSNTPLQALTLLNDSTSIEAATALAARIEQEGGATAQDQVNYAFRLCTGRRPSSRELRAMVDFYDRAADAEPDSGAKALFLLSQALLNLDETITKE